MAKKDDSFEIDSESERTLTEEPKEPKAPKFEINRGETPEHITRTKLAPVVLPFKSDTGKGLKLKTETKAIVKLKKLDINPGKGIEKKPIAAENDMLGWYLLRQVPVRQCYPAKEQKHH